MKTNGFLAGMLVVPLALFAVGSVIASSVAPLPPFVSGEIASAAAMNEVLETLREAINDNDARLSNRTRVASATINNNSVVWIGEFDADLKALASVEIVAPQAGTVTVQLTGHAVFFADRKTIRVAVSDQATGSLGSTSVNLGRLDGGGTDRYMIPFAAMRTFPVAAGTHTFYGLAQGNTVFDNGGANVVPSALVATFHATD